ncbi:hypothetical protein [Aegicerativicinus sediminis]|uniref:hypothetical protein n=1 Tax=Aegicerativicinus sediminis TaxID=2893202 RepID=UPI001E485439|nr:hypothetical protein [Aegicerativicinus sediminis]
MGHKLIMAALAITSLFSCKREGNSNTENTTIEPKIEIISENQTISQNIDLEKYIYTDTTYLPIIGKGIRIQNSLPKGGTIAPDGTQYIDPSGKSYAFAVFWTRIVNETNTPIELNINFPSDSSAIFTPPGSYLKLFLPTDNMSFDKLSSFNYGLTELKSFFDSNLNKGSSLHKIINPNEEHMYYIATLSYLAAGTPRAKLTLKENNLYYHMSLSPEDSGTMAVGNIQFK